MFSALILSSSLLLTNAPQEAPQRRSDAEAERMEAKIRELVKKLKAVDEPELRARICAWIREKFPAHPLGRFLRVGISP